MIMTAERMMMVDNLRDLLQALDALPTKIVNATASSSDARDGSAFLAYPGATRDGRHFIGDAIANGASAVLYEADDTNGAFVWETDWQVPSIGVRGLKSFASAVGAHIYHHPGNDLWVIGVTGTNGKTSVSQWLAQALELAGRQAAVMGTIGNGMVGALSESGNTTPDGLVVQQMLRRFADAGATACAMEVSSHGLDQGRVADVKFDVAVFTNLTRDHLDYHGTMENYGEAKAKLFAFRDLKVAVVNVDDAMGREIAGRVERRGIALIRYATNGGAKFANLVAQDIAVSSAGLSFKVRWLGNNTGIGAYADVKEALVETDVLGAFNAGNLLAVIGALMAGGIALSTAANIVEALKPVAGRMQTVRSSDHAGHNPNKPLVVVDYAHTPDALEKALSTISAIVPDKGRLISVFGCGGDRDRGKRPQMGAISAKYADFTIVTSDNPRTENGRQILLDIESGVCTAPHSLIEDRRQAIQASLDMVNGNDVVLIAGKGHEDYQIVGNQKHHFSDVDVAREALARWKGRSE